ncbi:MAG TPA: FecR domain-containing protein [Steroidobacteraceae bacterium]|nr:FecR domain-containing protein [Steroidobacteraceae bacterium]
MIRERKLEPSIAEQAAEWWARLHDEAVTPADQREFGDWVARSPERIAAYLQTAQLMRALRTGRAAWPQTPTDELIREAKAAPCDPMTLPGVRSESSSWQSPPKGHRSSRMERPTARLPRRLQVAWYACTAVVLLVIATGLWLGLPRPQEYATGFGEQRSILLADGSRVTLNTASHMEISFHQNRRVVSLLAGEALFEVAHDPARPFDVVVRDSVVRAIGTEFNVELRPRDATVTVVEGRVAVMRKAAVVVPIPHPHDATASLPGPGRSTAGNPEVQPFPAPPGSLILAAAERVVITASGPEAPQHIEDLTAATSWVERRLVFEHEPLSEVAARFNRYNREQIVIEGADLGRKEVTGVFRSDDPRSFLSFVSGLPGVSVRERSDGTQVVSERAPMPERPSRN